MSDSGECVLCKSASTATKTDDDGAFLKFHGRIELPQFSAEDDITLWWAQVERRLNLANLANEQSKYQYVSAALPMEIVRRVPDLVRTQPVDLPFTTLKNCILGEFEPTCTAKLNKLLEGCKLGDQKPSALLREMRQLASGRVDESVLRQLFFKQLPPFLTSIFITTGVTDLDKAAAAADKAKDEGIPSTSQIISAVKTDSSPSQAPRQSTHDLLIALTESVKQLHFQHQRSRSRSQSQNSRHCSNCHRSNSRENKRRFTKYCYHFKFSDNAYC